MTDDTAIVDTALTLKRRCIGKKADGSGCSATPQKESDYCIFHDPAKEVERREAQSKGGLNRQPKWVSVMEDAGYQVEDVVAIINEVVNNLRLMPQEPATANSMLAAVRILLDIYELKTIGMRSDELEEMLRGMQTQGLVRER